MAKNVNEQRPSSDVFLSSVGVGISIALIYLGVIGGVFCLPGSEGLVLPPELVCLAVMSVLYGVATWRSDDISRISLRALFFGGLAAMAASVAASWALSSMQVHPAVSYALAVCYALGLVAFKFAGVGDFGYAKRGNAVFITCVILASAGFCIAVVPLFGHEMLYGALLVLLGIEAAFFQFSGATAPRHDPVDKKTSKERMHLDPGMAVAYGLVGMVISFVVLYLGRLVGTGPAMIVLGATVLLAVGAAAALAAAGRRSVLVMAPVYQATFLPLRVLVLVFPFVPRPWSLAVLALMLAVLFFRDLSRTLNRVVIVAEVEVQQVYVYAWTSFPLVVGLFLGGLLFFVDNAAGLGAHAVSAMLAILLCIASITAPYGSDPQSMPLRAPDARSGDSSGQVGYWRLACEELAEDRGLTSRELDVALLLSRGRTADVIARNLGISVHTVKTHISNVYRKAQAGSQQDFISMVEERFARMKREAEEPKERL